MIIYSLACSRKPASFVEYRSPYVLLYSSSLLAAVEASMAIIIFVLACFCCLLVSLRPAFYWIYVKRWASRKLGPQKGKQACPLSTHGARAGQPCQQAVQLCQQTGQLLLTGLSTIHRGRTALAQFSELASQHLQTGLPTIHTGQATLAQFLPDEDKVNRFNSRKEDWNRLVDNVRRLVHKGRYCPRKSISQPTRSTCLYPWSTCRCNSDNLNL
jgi:hypothetical protein